MNTVLHSYLISLGLHEITGGRQITQADIARAFGGRPAHLSSALHSAETHGGLPMLTAISMAARERLGEIGEREKAAFPIWWARAQAGLRTMAALRGGQ